MKHIISIFILFLIFIPLLSYAQSNVASTEKIQNILESFLEQNEKNNQETIQIISNIHETSSELNENLIAIQITNQKLTTSVDITLKEIKKTIIENQQRTEDTQLTNTLVQVSGIFVAIMGGFFTTKMLSMSTEKNRIQRKITEIDSEIDNNRDVVSHYQDIVDNLGTNWAEEDVRNFKDDLLKKYPTEEFSKEEMIDEYTKYRGFEYVPNRHELSVLDEQCDEINAEIRSAIKKREESLKNISSTKLSKLFAGIDPTVFDSLSSLPILGLPRNYEKYNEANEKLKIETSKENHLISQKHLLENEKQDLAVPTSLKRGIIFTFIAAIFGIIMPSMYQNFGYPLPSIIGLVGFLISLVIMFSYFAYEFTKEKLSTN